MYWDQAEIILRAHIETEWALSAFAPIPLVFENEIPQFYENYILINIEGVYSDKSIFGTTGNRISCEAGIVFYHSFGREGVGKNEILAPCVAMANILELRVIERSIYIDGANPPSPIERSDDLIPDGQPQGQYYRCSGSVPFMVIGTR